MLEQERDEGARRVRKELLRKRRQWPGSGRAEAGCDERGAREHDGQIYQWKKMVQQSG